MIPVPVIAAVHVIPKNDQYIQYIVAVPESSNILRLWMF